jgi:hypothetical protein
MKLYSHCVTVYEIDFFLKTAPRMQENYEIIAVVPLFIISNYWFFVKISPRINAGNNVSI